MAMISEAERARRFEWTDAAERGDEQALRRLHAEGAEVDARNGLGWRALELAGFAGRHGCVRLLVELGADLDAVDHNGWTAAMWMARQGRAESLALLLELGASVAAVGSRTPVGLVAVAAMRSQPQCLELALAAGAEIPESIFGDPIEELGDERCRELILAERERRAAAAEARAIAEGLPPAGPRETKAPKAL